MLFQGVLLISMVWKLKNEKLVITLDEVKWAKLRNLSFTFKKYEIENISKYFVKLFRENK